MNLGKLVSAAALPLLLCFSSGGNAQPISEETPPTTCGNLLVAGLTCTGHYCDNMEALCGVGRHEIYNIKWSKFVSEEGDAAAQCKVPNPWERSDSPEGESAFITGFSCNGKYCDNVALECVALKDAFPDSSRCQWTSWVSEETPTLRFPLGYGAISMACRGRYCDDKRFLICPVIPR